MTTIKLTDGREVQLKINNRALYMFENSGHRLSDIQDRPITSMVNLVKYAGNLKEPAETLVDLLPPLPEVAKLVEQAIEESGLQGEAKPGTDGPND